MCRLEEGIDAFGMDRGIGADGGGAAGEDEVEVAVGDVDGDDAVAVAQVGEVEGEGLAGEQVGGDGVAAKGVEGEDVEALGRLALEVDAGVADRKLDVAEAVAQVGEEGGVAAGEGGDVGVDLVAADGVAGGGVAGEGASAEADEAEVERLAALAPGMMADRKADGAARAIVGGGDAGELGVGELQAVDDATVTQSGASLARVAGVVVDAQDAEEAARDVDPALKLAVGVIDEGAGEDQQVGAAQGGDDDAMEARPLRAAQGEADGEGAGGDDGERELPEVGEDGGGDDASEDATRGAADGDEQIKAGEAARLGLEAHELAVADHAGEEEGAEVGGELEHHGDVDALAQDGDGASAGEQEQRDPQGALVGALVFEAEDEAQEIEREREHPQEGDDGDLERDLAGDREQEDGGDHGEGEP